ncbi:hypothetical protein BC829DRAFT_443120 [Chytridium lagenaria]|nr:hypothetical protein BC829DRAFT_443120 [Chytridium lagenaria]
MPHTTASLNPRRSHRTRIPSTTLQTCAAECTKSLNNAATFTLAIRDRSWRGGARERDDDDDDDDCAYYCYHCDDRISTSTEKTVTSTTSLTLETLTSATESQSVTSNTVSSITSQTTAGTSTSAQTSTSMSMTQSGSSSDTLSPTSTTTTTELSPTPPVSEGFPIAASLSLAFGAMIILIGVLAWFTHRRIDHLRSHNRDIDIPTLFGLSPRKSTSP